MTDKELEFIETEITDLYSRVRTKFSNYVDNKIGEESTYDYHYDLQEDEAVIIYWTEKLYHNLLVYFEAKGFSQYAKKFQMEFSEPIKIKANILKYDYNGHYDYLSFKILDSFAIYFSPFKKLAKESSERIDELEKLKNILESTSQVLGITKTKPKSEKIIYDQVRLILDLYFDTRKSTSRFMGKFKTYKADILILDLGTAIEYKLIRETSNIDDYLDQIIIDARNYKGDPQYQNFFAVVCVESKTVTDLNIKKAWTEKLFPNNWSLIIARV